MARFGIRSPLVLGVPVPEIRRVARSSPPNHGVASHLWSSGIFEARLLAAMVDEPDRVLPGQMNRWAAQFDNWAVCDGVCQDLFRKTPHAMARALAWTGSDGEFVKRAGFSLIAEMAVPGQNVEDRILRATFPAIERGSDDERRTVRQAVSWALRQIGKRSPGMRREVCRLARRILRRRTRGAVWVARDVLRELENPAVIDRVRRRARRRARSRDPVRARRPGALA